MMKNKTKRKYETKHSNLTFHVKRLAEDDEFWRFGGYASTFGNVDLVGDSILKGAFERSLGERMPKLLWSHQPESVIGAITKAYEDNTGLYVEGILPKDIPESQRAGRLLKMKAIDSMSIGYRVVDAEQNSDGVNLIKDLDLWEVSLVAMPANTLAVVDSIKKRPLKKPTLRHDMTKKAHKRRKNENAKPSKPYVGHEEAEDQYDDEYEGRLPETGNPGGEKETDRRRRRADEEVADDLEYDGAEMYNESYEDNSEMKAGEEAEDYEESFVDYSASAKSKKKRQKAGEQAEEFDESFEDESEYKEDDGDMDDTSYGKNKKKKRKAGDQAEHYSDSFEDTSEMKGGEEAEHFSDSFEDDSEMKADDEDEENEDYLQRNRKKKRRKAGEQAENFNDSFEDDSELKAGEEAEHFSDSFEDESEMKENDRKRRHEKGTDSDEEYLNEYEEESEPAFSMTQLREVVRGIMKERYKIDEHMEDEEYEKWLKDTVDGYLDDNIEQLGKGKKSRGKYSDKIVDMLTLRELKSARELENLLRESGNFSKGAAIYMASRFKFQPRRESAVASKETFNTVALVTEMKKLIQLLRT